MCSSSTQIPACYWTQMTLSELWECNQSVQRAEEPPVMFWSSWKYILRNVWNSYTYNYSLQSNWCSLCCRATIHHNHRMQLKTPCGNTTTSGFLALCSVVFFFFSYSTEHGNLLYYFRIRCLCSPIMLPFKQFIQFIRIFCNEWRLFHVMLPSVEIISNWQNIIDRYETVEFFSMNSVTNCNSCKLFQENVSEAQSRPIWWFISHLAPLCSYFVLNPQTVVTLWEAVAQLCHFMNIFLPLGAFFNTVGTWATTVLRIGQRIRLELEARSVIN